VREREKKGKRDKCWILTLMHSKMPCASSIIKRKRFVGSKRLDLYQKFSFEVLVDWPVLRCRVLGSLCRTAKG
jgi:hypothetical protein